MFKTAFLQSRRSVSSLSRTRLNMTNPLSNNNNSNTSSAMTNEETQKRFRSDANIRYKFIVSDDVNENIHSYVKQVGVQPMGAVEKCEEVYYDYAVRDQDDKAKLPVREGERQEEKTETSVARHGRLNTEDRSPMALTKQDIWLQRHNGHWVCKTPFKDDMTQKTHLATPFEDRVPNFRTLKGEREIRIELNLQQDVLDKEHLKTMEESLAARGMVPYATIVTETTKYQLPDEFVLEMVSTDFGYKTGVLSIFVQQAKERDIQQVAERLQKMIQNLGIQHVDYTPTPAMEYIFKNRKDHYRTLVRAGVAPEKKE